MGLNNLSIMWPLIKHMSHLWYGKSCIEHKTTYHMSFIEHMDKKSYSCANCNYLKIILVKYNRKLNNLQMAICMFMIHRQTSNYGWSLEWLSRMTYHFSIIDLHWKQMKSNCACKYRFVVTCVVRSMTCKLPT
jgi:hypothetical protein